MKVEIANAIISAIVSVGKKENAAVKETAAAVALLEENKITTETELYQFALVSKNWQEEWPKPRSLWQEISRGKTTGGKKVKWEVSARFVVFTWSKEDTEFEQSAPLALVAGLGRLCGRLAVAKSRSSSTSKGSDSTSPTSSEKLAKAEIEKAKTETETARKELDSLKKELQKQKAAWESGLTRDKRLKAERQNTSAALAALEEAKKKAAKAAQERDRKENALLAIANSLEKAHIDAPKEELWSILEEIRAALAKNTEGIKKPSPQPMP